MASKPTATAAWQNPSGSATYEIPYQKLTLSIPVDGQVFNILGNVGQTQLGIRQGNVVKVIDFQALGQQTVNSALQAVGVNPSNPVVSANDPRIAQLQAQGVPSRSWANGTVMLGTDGSWGGGLIQIGQKVFQQSTGLNAQTLFSSAPTYNMGDVSTAFSRMGGSAGSQLAATDLTKVFSNPAPATKPEVVTQTISPVNPQGVDIKSNTQGVLAQSPSLQQNLSRAAAENSTALPSSASAPPSQQSKPTTVTVISNGQATSTLVSGNSVTTGFVSVPASTKPAQTLAANAASNIFTTPSGAKVDAATGQLVAAPSGAAPTGGAANIAMSARTGGLTSAPATTNSNVLLQASRTSNPSPAISAGVSTSVAGTTPATAACLVCPMGGASGVINKLAQSTPVSIAVETATTMLGTFVGQTTPLLGNAKATTAVKILKPMNTTSSIIYGMQSGGVGGGLSAAVKKFGSTAAGNAAVLVAAPSISSAGAVTGTILAGGVAAAGAGTFVGSYLISENYIAPHFAPALGAALYDLAPQLFTPRDNSHSSLPQTQLLGAPTVPTSGLLVFPSAR